MTKDVPPGMTVVGLNKLLDPHIDAKREKVVKKRTETWQYEVDTHLRARICGSRMWNAPSPVSGQVGKHASFYNFVLTGKVYARAPHWPQNGPWTGAPQAPQKVARRRRLFYRTPAGGAAGGSGRRRRASILRRRRPWTGCCSSTMAPWSRNALVTATKPGQVWNSSGSVRPRRAQRRFRRVVPGGYLLVHFLSALCCVLYPDNGALHDRLLRIIRIARRHRGHLDVRHLGVRGRLRLPLLCLPSAMAYAAADANEDDANGQTDDEDEVAIAEVVLAFLIEVPHAIRGRVTRDAVVVVRSAILVANIPRVLEPVAVGARHLFLARAADLVHIPFALLGVAPLAAGVLVAEVLGALAAVFPLRVDGVDHPVGARRVADVRENTPSL